MNVKELEELKDVLLAEKNTELSVDQIIMQIMIFSRGIPYLKLVRPCKIGDGIKVIPEDEQEEYVNMFLSALENGRVIKFVPSSGAATRMFQKQLSVLAKHHKTDIKKIRKFAESGDEDAKGALEFFENIHRFAFYNQLEKIAQNKGLNFKDLVANGNIAEIIQLVTGNLGLNYTNLPKGCLPFHYYPDDARTAFEEHIVEAINYSSDKDKVVRVHFTLSPEHEFAIKDLFDKLFDKYYNQGWKLDIGFSFQSPNTNTVSVTMDNKPFRDENGKIIFRPGGHGALLINLSDLKADIVLIKNIDNIVPDHLRIETYRYKKILGGYLVFLQNQVFNILDQLEKELVNEHLIDKTIEFIKNEFGMDLSVRLTSKSLSEKKDYLFNFLNRPIRACGMVKKENHPGGSPFWIEDENQEITKQIVETAQVDHSDKRQLDIFSEATHFNPVDLACGVKNYKGINFNLHDYSNPETGLITKKSKNGKELKALELPGLWNGGMYHWLTVFVEVPKITFNPVKEVSDLLKPEHQPHHN